MAERWKPSVTVAAIARRSRTSAAGVVDEYLVVEEKTSEGLRINNPAGHLEAGESLVDAVAREALEETGASFVADRLVGIYQLRVDASEGDATYLRFAFAGTAGAADPARRLDDGIVRTLWLTLDELRACRARHRSVLVLRSVEDAAAGCAVPLERIFTDASVRNRGDDADTRS